MNPKAAKLPIFKSSNIWKIKEFPESYKHIIAENKNSKIMNFVLDYFTGHFKLLLLSSPNQSGKSFILDQKLKKIIQ